MKRKLAILTQKLGRTPTLDEMSVDLQLSKSAISWFISMSAEVISIDNLIHLEEKTVYDNTLLYNGVKVDNLSALDLRDNTDSAISALLPYEQKILRLRYGFHDGTYYTLKQIGRIMGLSVETIRQKETRALLKLRRKFDHLKEFLA